ncbi:MAG TPA: flagellar hook protein FlgE [Terriglobia bacterium]|nr:flagellar hook protein FlgE [Terriglobia bacterium]
MSSFSISLSGLLADDQELSVLSNNLANLNTVGYKGETAQFQDLFYQEVGSNAGSNGAGDPVQVGAGAEVGSTPTDFTQGTLDSTGLSTDMAIQGAGFLLSQHGNVTQYTRDGNLSTNAQGYLVTSDGSEVLGYPAVNGVANSSGALGPLQVNNGQSSPPQATSNVTLALNLNAGANADATSAFSSEVAAYDSLGSAHVLTFTFTKTATNTWSYSVTIPATDVGTGAAGNPVVLAQSTPGSSTMPPLTFDANGNLTSPNPKIPISLTLPTGDTLADGGSLSSKLAWNLVSSGGSAEITQVANPSATSSTQQDGYAAGSLTGFTVASNGTIQGSFTNGQTVALGQIALASFPNTQGLLRTGSNNYMASLASGLPTVGAPGSGGRGTISDGSLENSNVDIATQFAQLILAERGYQANSQAVKTEDQVLQTALSILQ